jgi:hypothetical protein
VSRPMAGRHLPKGDSRAHDDFDGRPRQPRSARRFWPWPDSWPALAGPSAVATPPTCASRLVPPGSPHFVHDASGHRGTVRSLDGSERADAPYRGTAAVDAGLLLLLLHEQEQLVECNPAVNSRRLKIDYQSRTIGSGRRTPALGSRKWWLWVTSSAIRAAMMPTRHLRAWLLELNMLLVLVVS